MARTIKRHDTADPITGTVTHNGGTVDLTIYQTVKFQCKDQGGTLIFGGTVSSRDNQGNFTYSQTDADVSQDGIYGCELECTLASGKKVHFPNSQAANEVLTIDQDIDNL